MNSRIKAYLVCEQCGGYGEQTPSTAEQEEKLSRALTSSRRPRMPCPSCGGSMELLTQEEFEDRTEGHIITPNDPQRPWYEKQEQLYHDFKMKHGSPTVWWLLSLLGLVLLMVLARSCGMEGGV